MSLAKLKKAIAIFSSSLDLELALKKLKSETTSLQYNTEIVDDNYLLTITGTDAEIFYIKMMLTNKGIEEQNDYRVSKSPVDLFPAIGATFPASNTPNLEPDTEVLDLR
ncbi:MULTISPECIES: hypothetical protein [unclassified Spirulina]|uniref:hypothetical protein n=1 Tax=unclassified Spirulina TaxID=2684457 RepID=UPI00195222F9|nr:MULTISPECIES: hypothetical protein [Spirulina]MEA5471566.1 hypothetical protein [Spirulina sp. 06S082]